MTPPPGKITYLVKCCQELPCNPVQHLGETAASVAAAAETHWPQRQFPLPAHALSPLREPSHLAWLEITVDSIQYKAHNQSALILLCFRSLWGLHLTRCFFVLLEPLYLVTFPSCKYFRPSREGDRLDTYDMDDWWWCCMPKVPCRGTTKGVRSCPAVVLTKPVSHLPCLWLLINRPWCSWYTLGPPASRKGSAVDASNVK